MNVCRPWENEALSMGNSEEDRPMLGDFNNLKLRPN